MQHAHYSSALGSKYPILLVEIDIINHTIQDKDFFIE